MKRLAIGLVLVTVHFSLITSSPAQVPQLINYQGKLINGTNLVNGTVGATLRIFWSETGGPLMYECSNNVPVVDGIYSAFLGSNTTFGTLSGALGADAYLEVAVNGATLSPRERIASVAFAQIAGNVTNGAIGAVQLADNAVTANKIAAGAVTSAAIANASITSNKIDWSTMPPPVSGSYVQKTGDTMTGALTINEGGQQKLTIGSAGFIVAIGNGANGDTGGGVAVGYQADAQNFGVAAGAQANGADHGAAMGSEAKGSANGSAVGYQANGNDEGAAVGSLANGINNGAAVGYAARGNLNGAALGNAADGSVDGVAVGNQANGFNQAVAVGYAATGGMQSVAVGYRSSALSGGVGVGAYAEGDNGVAVGQSALGSQHGAALGFSANAVTSGVAIGESAIGNDSGAAVGYYADGSSTGVAVGAYANGRVNGAAVGCQADGYFEGSVVGYQANGANFGVAVGYQADGEYYGAAVGYTANGNFYGTALGLAANGYSFGAAVGPHANGESYGAAIGNFAVGSLNGAAAGYQANGYNYGTALGAEANGYSECVAVGAYANAGVPVHAVALGYKVTNDVANSTRVRGTLYLDGGTGVLYRSTFGDGAWSAKAFTIDHPLDPQNKVLRHFCVEGPVLWNVYKGTARLDAMGMATVKLPDYFDALNKNAQYDLTPIGNPMPNLFVKQTVQNNQFVIGGGIANGDVCWTVSGERNDPAAVEDLKQRPVEQLKSELQPGQAAAENQTVNTTAVNP